MPLHPRIHALLKDGLLVDPLDHQPLTVSADGRWLENLASSRRYPIDRDLPLLQTARAEAMPEDPKGREA